MAEKPLQPWIIDPLADALDDRIVREEIEALANVDPDPPPFGLVDSVHGADEA